MSKGLLFPVGKGQNLICPGCGHAMNCYRPDPDGDLEEYECYHCGMEGNNKFGLHPMRRK